MSALKWIFIVSIFLISKIVVAAETVNLKKNELSKVSNQIQSLQKTLAQDQQQHADLQHQLKTTEIEMSRLSEQLTKLNLDIAKEARSLADLNTQKNQSSTRLAIQSKAFSEQIRAAYQLKSLQQWKALLNQQDMTSVSRHLIYYRYLAEARLKLIREMKQTINQLAATIQMTRTHQQIMKKLADQKQWQQKQQQQIIQTRQQLISKLNLQTKNKQQQLNNLRADQKALREMITKLQTQDITIHGHAFKQLQKKLAWPVQGALLASFGSQMDVGNQRLPGVLIKATPGTPVRAIYAGKVIFANWLRGFGLLIIINHGDNYMSLYARNQTLFAKVGDYIKAGSVIATTGSTGGYQKPGLYFEIRQNGSPVNPQLWCRS